MKKIDTKVLEHLNSQLISKNKETEQLVAHVAHELLTPITSLTMTTDEICFKSSLSSMWTMISFS